MVDNESMVTAKKFGIVDTISKLKDELMSIEGVSSIEFDLDGFYSDIYQVIILVGYSDIAVDDKFFVNRKVMLSNVLNVIEDNDLSLTEDPIEDYGAHYYIVTDMDTYIPEKMKVGN